VFAGLVGGQRREIGSQSVHLRHNGELAERTSANLVLIRYAERDIPCCQWCTTAIARRGAVTKARLCSFPCKYGSQHVFVRTGHSTASGVAVTCTKGVARVHSGTGDTVNIHLAIDHLVEIHSVGTQEYPRSDPGRRSVSCMHNTRTRFAIHGNGRGGDDFEIYSCCPTGYGNSRLRRIGRGIDRNWPIRDGEGAKAGWDAPGRGARRMR